MKRLSPFATAIALGCSFLFAAPASSQPIVAPVDRQATTNELSNGRAGERLIKYRHQIPQDFTSVDTSLLMGTPDPLPLEPMLAFPALKFDRPVELTHADDGSNRVFVVEQRGVIYVFENNEDVRDKKVFLDIQEVVSRDGNEEGLLGLAFHPDYKVNGEFFVYYSTRPRASVVSRFRVSKADGNRADRESEEALLRIEQPYSNHNGGSIRFGPDGYLYIGLGDGGLANDPHVHGQNLSTLLGSILRIDIDHSADDLAYAIPKDNPFVERKDARGEIWAYGLRNVWRMSFDSKTGELWAADVGQDRVEEVNLIERGGNYGWNEREGFQSFEPNVPHKPNDMIDPLAEYSRQDGQSITGGMVYRGNRLPEFEGAYFYGDYLSGKVWTLRRDNSQVAKSRLVCETGLEIAAFGEDSNGEMFLCGFDGNLYKLNRRDVDLQEIADAFPRRLSQTGLFASVADNDLVQGMIPYEMNLPFWSDYSVKDRYIALPEKGKVKFDKREKWQFPIGTVFVKTFWMHSDRVKMRDPVRLETRLLVLAPHGWEGYTYVYNEDQSDAILLEGSMVRPIQVHTDDGLTSQPYYFPSRSDCFACHTKAEGFVLGMTTRQMNHVINYRGLKENQITMLDRLGVFEEAFDELPENLESFPVWGFGNFDRSKVNRAASGEDLKDEGEPAGANHPVIPEGDVQVLARAWLEVNCAVCHRPEGIAPHKRDMRFHTSNKEMGLIGESPSQGQLGPPGSDLIKPSAPFESELFFRMNRRGSRQMPPLSTKLVDPIAHEVLKQWIEGMPDGSPLEEE